MKHTISYNSNKHTSLEYYSVLMFYPVLAVSLEISAGKYDISARYKAVVAAVSW